MSKTYMVKMRFIEGCWSILFVMLLCMGVDAYAQTYPVRKYMNTQVTRERGFTVPLFGPTYMGEVLSAANAVNGRPNSSSTLKVPSVISLLSEVSATQFLAFSPTGDISNITKVFKDSVVTVKLTFPKTLLGIGSGFEVGWFKDIAEENGVYSATQKVEKDGSALLSLLKSSGDVELRLKAPNGDYQGVYVKLSGGGVSLGLSNTLFHAYLIENTVVPAAEREEIIDVVSGARAPDLVGKDLTDALKNP